MQVDTNLLQKAMSVSSSKKTYFGASCIFMLHPNVFSYSGYLTIIFHTFVLSAVSGKFHYRPVSLGLISLTMRVAEHKL